MARVRSLENLIQDVRQRTNMEESEFLDDQEELTEYINQELAELHAKLAQCEGQPHFRSQTSLSSPAGTGLIALPSDFWRVQRVVATINGRQVDLEPFMEGERAGLSNTSVYGYVPFGAGGRMYRVQGSYLEILPSRTAFTGTLFYIQRSPRLVALQDVVDGFNGYEMAAIYGVCATIAKKEEGDPSFYLDQRDRIYRHIESMAAHRDGSHPERVTDVTGALDGPWGYR